MRTFVALNLSAELRAAVHSAAAPLREALGRDVAWIAEPSLHLTLKFLGELPDASVERLAVMLAPLVRASAPCPLRIGGVGAFPSLVRPNVLWIGVAANTTLARLYQRVDDLATSLGVQRETRPFHPHVTLGRIRARAVVDATALSAAAATVTFTATAHVATVDVMESMLGPGGSRYRVAAALPLAGRTEEG